FSVRSPCRRRSGEPCWLRRRASDSERLRSVRVSPRSSAFIPRRSAKIFSARDLLPRSPGTALARRPPGVRQEDPMPKPSSSRWLQLVLGLIVMMTISSPQYVWTLFVKPLQATTSGTLPAVQITFSLLIVLQTWLSPAQGYLV